MKLIPVVKKTKRKLNNKQLNERLNFLENKILEIDVRTQFMHDSITKIIEKVFK